MRTKRPSGDADLRRSGLSVRTMPGDRLLGRLARRALRPGGLTRPAIGSADDVVEFAPGLGTTAALAIVGQKSELSGSASA